MPFAYYKKLNPLQRKIYDASNERPAIRLPAPPALKPYVAALERALQSASAPQTKEQAQALANALCDQLRVARAQIKVLEKRPALRGGELHGLYEPAGSRSFPVISVWMRTAKRIQVVAFKTFLRTLLHELIHHFDYVLLHLADSFHTEGFYQRESSLLKQLIEEKA